MAQKSGGPPRLMVPGRAPGESGLSVLGLGFDEAVHFDAVPQEHLVWLQLSDVHMTCRRAGRVILEDAIPAGSLAICPAGLDCAGDAEESAAAILVAVQPNHLALAAADDSSVEAQLMDRTLGDDRALFELGRILARESADDYPNGPLFWHDAASCFIAHLVKHHSARHDHRKSHFLEENTIRRLREYVMAHLAEPIEVAALAAIAGRSPFHFSRVFARCVGMSPHRYVVHLRLKHAVELIRYKGLSLADVAVCAGFADQSHLSRWVRRVYGVSLKTIAAHHPE